MADVPDTVADLVDPTGPQVRAAALLQLLMLSRPLPRRLVEVALPGSGASGPGAVSRPCTRYGMAAS